METEKTAIQYNRAKWWQLLLFAFNNSASNIYLMTMMFVSYYANGVAGLGLAFVSNIITLSRIWDGITDPIIGFVMDKTKGRFGRFRPFMLGGNLIMLLTITLMFHTTHLVPEGFRGIYWILLYLIYIVGYTFQNGATRGGQAVLTNDPKQRPMFARIDAYANIVVMLGLQVFITRFLHTKHGGYTGPLYVELISILGPVSLLLTILALIGIAQKDKPEYYEALGSGAAYKFKDIFRIIKDNRAIQMLVVAASTDKLANQVKQQTAVGVMLYGIVIGSYSMLSQMTLITMIPGMVVVWIGTSVAAKYSSKRSMVIFTSISLACAVAMAMLLIFGDPTQISFSNIGFMTIAYIALLTISGACGNVTTSLATPMIADCADYELYRSGSYAPALMGTVFGFFDKLVSSFAATIVGYGLILVGYQDLPKVGDPLTPGIFWLTMFLFFGMPILGWVASLIAMKFYPLDKEKMEEVQLKIADIKAQERAR